MKIPLAILLASSALLLMYPSFADQPRLEANPDAPAGVHRLEVFAGQWELTIYDRQPDGGFAVGRATSNAYFILDGYAMQDDFRFLDQAGRVVFRGTSIRTYDVQSGKWLVRWLMVDDPGMTVIEANFDEEGNFVATGTGHDRGGEFLERFTYSFPSPDRYVFEMSRSYDGGNTWIENFNRIEATRR